VLLLWVGSKLWKRFKTKKTLQIREAKDETKQGVMDLFVASLHQWRMRQSRANEGLLRLEVPRTAALLGRLPKDQLLTALDKLPSGGAVDLKGLAGVLQTVCNWFTLCPPWMIADFQKDDTTNEIIARVTMQRKTDQVVLLSRWPIKDRPEEKVDSLAFKVLYLWAEEGATLKQAEAFDELRHGLGRLNLHLTGEKLDRLEDILNMFRTVRQKYPRLLPAYLYEGFALDLLGDHEEAARKLQFVKEKALEEDDKKLSQRAAYNEAIAHLHNYTYEEVKESVKLLKELTGTVTDKTFESPLKTMAYAAQACVTAHLPLFWKEVEPKLPQTLAESEIPYYKKQRREKLLTWRHDVQTITDILNDIEKKISKEITDAAKKRIFWKRRIPAWDRSDCRRLQLSIHDAWAHFYLNCAVEFLDGPTPDFGAEFSQKHFLDLAREEFRQCELLQPPEVENRADIGTLYLFLGEYETARRYLEDAVQLKNETYEYAFLRLAQTYEKEKKFELVVETLKRFKGPRRLKEFKAMCEKYLPSPPGRMEKLKIWYPLGEPDATN
jgi:tetratricopeptide (TPR) repeat protein